MARDVNAGKDGPRPSEADTDLYPDPPAGVEPSILAAPLSIVITDPRQGDNPIVYVNRAFVRMTGYAPQSVLGRNCRFLQGADREQEGLSEIRAAVRERHEATVDLINYRADGSVFVNRLMVAPLRDPNGEIAYFVGVQSERSGRKSDADRAFELTEKLRELQHRVRNHLSLVVSMIRLEARSATDVRQTISVLANRVEALALLYEQIDDGEDPGQEVALGTYVSRVASTLQTLSPRLDLRVNVAPGNVRTTAENASRIGLLLTELLTNAFKHAFEDGEADAIHVALDEDEDDIRLWVADNGRGLQGRNWPADGNFGGRIVRELVARLDATIDVGEGLDGRGTGIVVRVPNKAATGIAAA